MTVLRQRLSLIAAALLAVPGGAVARSPSKGPPNALQGFSQNRDQPVHIEAATLEVRDKDKVATFSGNVHVKQGDTSMRCKSLVVFYEGRTRRERRQEQDHARRPSPAPAASRRSSGWKRAAAWW